MSVWYYRVGGKEIGPLKSSEIVAHVRQGRVTADTLVRKNDSQWVPAAEVTGLLDAASSDADRQHRCPYCGETVPPPPSTCPNCYRDVVVSFKGKPDEQRKPKKSEPTEVDEEEKREQRIAELREQQRRRDIWVYAICLLLWAILIVAAPFLHRLADEGRLGVDRIVVSSILGVVGILFAVVAVWLTRSG